MYTSTSITDSLSLLRLLVRPRACLSISRYEAGADSMAKSIKPPPSLYINRCLLRASKPRGLPSERMHRKYHGRERHSTSTEGKNPTSNYRTPNSPHSSSEGRPLAFEALANPPAPHRFRAVATVRKWVWDLFLDRISMRQRPLTSSDGRGRGRGHPGVVSTPEESIGMKPHAPEIVTAGPVPGIRMGLSDANVLGTAPPPGLTSMPLVGAERGLKEAGAIGCCFFHR